MIMLKGISETSNIMFLYNVLVLINLIYIYIYIYLRLTDALTIGDNVLKMC